MNIGILGFDPGLTLAGWAVCDYNTQTGQLVIHKFGTISANKVVSRANMREEVELYGKRIMALSYLRQQVYNLLMDYKPTYVVSEDAFFDFRRPTAYAALLQWLTAVELVLKDNLNMQLFKVAPKLVKACMSGMGDAKKVGIQNAIINSKDIQFKQKNYESDLEEHTADAIAVCYTFTREILPSLTVTLVEDNAECLEKGTNEKENQ